MGILLNPIDDVIIDPVALGFLLNEEEAFIPDPIYRETIRRASLVFQLGHWRALRRAAEARNDFATLDHLDKTYEMIGTEL